VHHEPERAEEGQAGFLEQPAQEGEQGDPGCGMQQQAGEALPARVGSERGVDQQVRGVREPARVAELPQPLGPRPERVGAQVRVVEEEGIAERPRVKRQRRRGERRRGEGDR